MTQSTSCQKKWWDQVSYILLWWLLCWQGGRGAWLDIAAWWCPGRGGGPSSSGPWSAGRKPVASSLRTWGCRCAAEAGRGGSGGEMTCLYSASDCGLRALDVMNSDGLAGQIIIWWPRKHLESIWNRFNYLDLLMLIGKMELKSSENAPSI